MSQPTPNLSRASSYSEGPKCGTNSANIFNMAALADALQKEIHKEDAPFGHEGPPVVFERDSFDAPGQPCTRGLFSFLQNLMQKSQHCLGQQRADEEVVDVPN